MSMKPPLYFILVGLSLVTCTTALVLPERYVISKAVKKWTGIFSVATTLVATPIVAPSVVVAVAAPDTALVVNVDASNPAGLAKSIFFHRGEIAEAAKHFLQSVKTLGEDLQGVLPPDSTSFSVQLPVDPKGAARDAASGIARIFVNGSPVYVEVKSEEEMLSLNVLVQSPNLPKVPFLAPTENSLDIPATLKATKAENLDDKSKATGFLGNVPVANGESTLVLTAELAILAIPTVYAVSYKYYTSQIEMEAQEAAEKKKKLEKKKSPVSEDSTSILKKDGVEPRETDLKKKAQVKKSAVAEKASVILTNVDVEEQVAESKNQIQGVKSAVVEDLPVATNEVDTESWTTLTKDITEFGKKAATAISEQTEKMNQGLERLNAYLETNNNEEEQLAPLKDIGKWSQDVTSAVVENFETINQLLNEYASSGWGLEALNDDEELKNPEVTLMEKKQPMDSEKETAELNEDAVRTASKESDRLSRLLNRNSKNFKDSESNKNKEARSIGMKAERTDNEARPAQVKDAVQLSDAVTSTIAKKKTRLNQFLSRSEKVAIDFESLANKDGITIAAKREKITQLLKRDGDAPLRDIGEVRKEVASTLAEKVAMMERLQKSQKVAGIEVVADVITEAEEPNPKKRFGMRRFLTRIFMPWRK